MYNTYREEERAGSKGSDRITSYYFDGASDCFFWAGGAGAKVRYDTINFQGSIIIVNDLSRKM